MNGILNRSSLTSLRRAREGKSWSNSSSTENMLFFLGILRIKTLQSDERVSARSGSPEIMKT